MLYRNFYFLIFCVALYGLAVPYGVHAYLDAGTGSYLVQIAIAFVAGGLFMFKTFWRKLWFFLKRGKKSVEKSNEVETKEPS